MGRGVGESLFPIIWFTMWSNKLYNFQSLVGVSASISPFRPGHGHYHAYNRTKQWTFIQPFLFVINTYRSWRINHHLIFWQYEMSIYIEKKVQHIQHSPSKGYRILVEGSSFPNHLVPWLPSCFEKRHRLSDFKRTL